MSTLSVIIICKNEARVIEKTLSCVHGWADEIVVLSNGSTDATVEIAKKYTSNVFETDWPGYGPQRNRALDKASKDWILTLDADERVTEELKKEISDLLENGSKCDGYRIPVRLLYFDKYVRSLLKNKPIILFRRDKGRFNNAQAHAAVVVDGKIGALHNHILHDSYESLSHQIQKLNKYALMWAEEQPGVKNGLLGLFIAITHAVWVLFKDLILKMAPLDGWRGILLSIVHAQYTFNKHVFNIYFASSKTKI